MIVESNWRIKWNRHSKEIMHAVNTCSCSLWRRKHREIDWERFCSFPSKEGGYINHPHWSSFPFGYFIVCLFIFFPIITTATSMLLNTTVQFLSAYNLYLRDVCRVKDKDRRKVAPNKSRCPILRRVRPFEVPVYRSLTVTEPWISSKKVAFLVRNVGSGATHQNRFT